MAGEEFGRRLAGARGQRSSVLIRGWVLERLRQETTGGELLASRDKLARDRPGAGRGRAAEGQLTNRRRVTPTVGSQ